MISAIGPRVFCKRISLQPFVKFGHRLNQISLKN